MGILRKRKISPMTEDDNVMSERLLGPDEYDSDDEPRAKRCRLTVFQQTLSYLSYIVGKVAEYILPVSWHFGSSKVTELQRRRLGDLRGRLGVKYDQDTHGGELKRLWGLAFPDLPFVEGKTKQWQEMGWQGDHPSSDFRGGGFAALENLIYFGESKPLAFQRLCFKLQGKRSDWEYPFGAAGVNITFTLAKLLDLKGDGAPATGPGRAFLKLLDVGDAEHEKAFEEVFCMTFELLDKIWLEENADYMQFPIVMKQWEETLTKALLKRPSSLAQLEEFLMK
ncbi:engulfment and motility protein [Chloropicon primus]|uniref:Engulfment and motility protein n=1 Tax=Chloropicon primus TaxID=1764295 RepID=A0A5B8MQD1_9CHLO|nr:engulfment and motility protein [Chloropicon primus]UPR01035.1 engulfment and motility protein [Chloropicon primus]|mmetsp:Transcript_5686/g.17231  ORF Transcript_5686/g.17231 Transcript_5686/m.17231 type:complete len:281 (+) Transcript_5686:250-1092(+)|eukprot:QDZ21815.1 engulfment and motility protein [Chloropicon primus]